MFRAKRLLDHQHISDLAYQLVADLKIDEKMQHSKQPVVFELDQIKLPTKSVRQVVTYLNRTQHYYTFELKCHLAGLKYHCQLIVTEYGQYGHLYSGAKPHK